MRALSDDILLLNPVDVQTSSLKANIACVRRPLLLYKSARLLVKTQFLPCFTAHCSEILT